MTNSTKHYFVAITQNTRTVITRTDKCLVCGDDTYWSDDPDPVCKTCASNPENIARMLAEARDQLALSEASKTLAANELRELRAALERARALASTWAAKQYNGDLTAAVYNGCADELAAALSPDGAR